MIALAYLSLRAGNSAGETTQAQQMAHNLAHIPAYGLLTILLIYGFGRSKQSNIVRIAIFSFMYGLLMEALQSFVPNRYPSILDLCLNLIGIISVIILFKKTNRSSAVS